MWIPRGGDDRGGDADQLSPARSDRQVGGVPGEAGGGGRANSAPPSWGSTRRSRGRGEEPTLPRQSGEYPAKPGEGGRANSPPPGRGSTRRSRGRGGKSQLSPARSGEWVSVTGT